MALVFRTMIHDAGGRPQIGDRPNQLGVCVSAQGVREADILPGQDQLCHPGTGGMSVAPTIADLGFARIPKRLAQAFPGARANDNRTIFRRGEGTWTGAASFAPQLALVPDSATHANVEPAVALSIPSLQAAIAATEPDWTNAE